MKWLWRLPKAVLVVGWALLTGLLVQSALDDDRDTATATKRWLAGNPDRATHGR